MRKTLIEIKIYPTIKIVYQIGKIRVFKKEQNCYWTTEKTLRKKYGFSLIQYNRVGKSSKGLHSYIFWKWNNERVIVHVSILLKQRKFFSIDSELECRTQKPKNLHKNK